MQWHRGKEDRTGGKRDPGAQEQSLFLPCMAPHTYPRRIGDAEARGRLALGEHSILVNGKPGPPAPAPAQSQS